MEQNTKDGILNIGDLLTVLKVRWLVVLLVGILAAVIGFVYSNFFMIPQYRASAKMMVDTRSDTSATISSAQLSVAKQLALTFAEVIKTNTVIEPVIDELGLDESYGSVVSKLSIRVIENTQILQLSYIDEDPAKALKTIEKIVELAPQIINENKDISSGRILSVDIPVVSSSPISPNVTRITLLAFAIGLFGTYVIFVFVRVLDNKVKSADDIVRKLDLPVLGVIPDLDHISSK